VTSEARSLLAVDGLHVSYGAVRAVVDVSFTVGRGEIVTMIGPNGAGKSSTLRGLAGLAPVTAGRAELDGAPILQTRAHERPARGLVLVPEGRHVFGELSVVENLRLGGHVRSREEVEEGLSRAFQLFPVLARRREQPAGTLSGGEQQMLAIGRALMTRPKLLMLDEPSLGLAPRIVRQVLDLLRALRQEGVTILLVEQNANLALSVADRAYILRAGHIVGGGPAAELAGSGEIRQRYFGVAAPEA
jgi:branched-chain amino acid transport system ATP-binding protein